MASGCANSTTGINWTAVEPCWASLSTAALLATEGYLLTHTSAYSTLLQVSAAHVTLLADRSVTPLKRCPQSFSPFVPTVNTAYLPMQPLTAFQVRAQHFVRFDVCWAPPCMRPPADCRQAQLWTSPSFSATYATRPCHSYGNSFQLRFHSLRESSDRVSVEWQVTSFRFISPALHTS